MYETVLTALFVVEAEAERAATQLRAAGLEEADVAILPHGPEPDDRADQVGVPDSAAGVEGLRGDEDEPAATIRLTARLAHVRLDRDEIVAILNAAGGRIV
jgi:hypothetical protein